MERSFVTLNPQKRDAILILKEASCDNSPAPDGTSSAHLDVTEKTL